MKVDLITPIYEELKRLHEHKSLHYREFYEDTSILILYNREWHRFEALTAAINPKTKELLQKHGNDFNVFGTTAVECYNKIKKLLK
jgi:hypothetical protein